MNSEEIFGEETGRPPPADWDGKLGSPGEGAWNIGGEIIFLGPRYTLKIDDVLRASSHFREIKIDKKEFFRDLRFLEELDKSLESPSRPSDRPADAIGADEAAAGRDTATRQPRAAEPPPVSGLAPLDHES